MRLQTDGKHQLSDTTSTCRSSADWLSRPSLRHWLAWCMFKTRQLESTPCQEQKFVCRQAQSPGASQPLHAGHLALCCCCLQALAPASQAPFSSALHLPLELLLAAAARARESRHCDSKGVAGQQRAARGSQQEQQGFAAWLKPAEVQLAAAEHGSSPRLLACPLPASAR